jgi:hypothetical protein
LLDHLGMAQIFGLVRTLCVPQRPRKTGKGLLQRENIFEAFDDTVSRLPAHDWEFAFFPLFHGRNSAKGIQGLFSKPERVRHNEETTGQG